MEKIKVILRMRPMNQNEQKLKYLQIWNLNLEKNEISSTEENQYNTTFTYDSIISPKVKNPQAYQENCQDVIIRALDGIDTTIFVYGQTGAGKTFTMLGKDPQETKYDGVIYNGIVDIFKHISKEQDSNFKITCSYLEIYNEMVFDLLTKQEKMQEELQIFEDQKNNKFIVKGKMEIEVKNVKEVMGLINFGESNRTYAQTYFNHKSSRSHTIFQVQIENAKMINGEVAYVKESTLNFVDLAGNERLMYENKMEQNIKYSSRDVSPVRRPSQIKVGKANMNITNTKINESKHINKSLFFLTQVIQCVSQGQSNAHIPFRNSPLTKILRSSFGGHSRTVLILCISPTEKDFDITLSTLRFGKCAKQIENTVRTNIKTDFSKNAFDAIINSYEQKVNSFYERLNYLEKQHKNNISIWENIKKFKGKIFGSFMNFITPEQRYKYLLQEKQKSSQDFILYQPGIVFTKLEKEKSEDFPKKCHFCKMREMTIINKNIPQVNNHNKLEFLKILQEGETEMQQKLQMASDENIKRFGDLKEIFKVSFTFIENLIQKINALRVELLPFKNLKYVSCLNDEEINSYQNYMKKLWQYYYEEKVERKVVKKHNIIIQIKDKNEYVKQTEEELQQYQEFKEEISLNLGQFMQQAKHQEIANFKNFDLLKGIREKMQTFLGEIDQKNQKLQNNIKEMREAFKYEYDMNEKRLNFLWNQKMQNLGEEKIPHSQSTTNLFKREKKFQSFYDANILNLYNLLNRKLYFISSISNELTNLKNSGQKVLTSNIVEAMINNDFSQTKPSDSAQKSFDSKNEEENQQESESDQNQSIKKSQQQYDVSFKKESSSEEENQNEVYQEESNMNNKTQIIQQPQKIKQKQLIDDIMNEKEEEKVEEMSQKKFSKKNEQEIVEVIKPQKKESLADRLNLNFKNKNFEESEGSDEQDDFQQQFHKQYESLKNPKSPEKKNQQEIKQSKTEVKQLNDQKQKQNEIKQIEIKSNQKDDKTYSIDLKQNQNELKQKKVESKQEQEKQQQNNQKQNDLKQNQQKSNQNELRQNQIEPKQEKKNYKEIKQNKNEPDSQQEYEEFMRDLNMNKKKPKNIQSKKDISISKMIQKQNQNESSELFKKSKSINKNNSTRNIESELSLNPKHEKKNQFPKSQKKEENYDDPSPQTPPQRIKLTESQQQFNLPPQNLEQLTQIQSSRALPITKNQTSKFQSKRKNKQFKFNQSKQALFQRREH